jgi:hypothetical protein
MNKIMAAVEADYKEYRRFATVPIPFNRYLLNITKKLLVNIYDSDYRFQMTDAECAAIVTLLNT